jgi:hypothetical protein
VTADLRRAVTGLLSFAAAEEQALLAADGSGPGSGGGSPDQAAQTPAEAIEANPDLRANACRDPDLRVLREASPS